MTSSNINQLLKHFTKEIDGKLKKHYNSDSFIISSARFSVKYWKTYGTLIISS